MIVLRFFLNLAAFLIPAALAALACAPLARRSRDEWQLLAWTPVVPLAGWGLYIACGVTRDPTSHNLWPFELLVWAALSGTLFALFFVARHIADRPRSTWPARRDRNRPTSSTLKPSSVSLEHRLPIRRAALFLLLVSAATACNRSAPAPAPIPLFVGSGTSPGDAAAVERILDHLQLTYATATSAQLNRMSTHQLTSYQLIVVPGGNFIDMSASLTPQTTGRVRAAVQQGVNYLGICAGAFLAGDGRGAYNGLDLTSGVRFGFYAVERQGIRKAAVAVAAVDAPAIDQYWEDGPELSGWGAVVATYPDGTAAVVEGRSGRGWVILTGVHPEAPATWGRGLTFRTPASAANAYASTLVRAALRGESLPHY